MNPKYCEKCHGYYEPEGTVYDYTYGGQSYEDRRCKHREVCALAYNIATIVVEEKKERKTDD